MDRLHLPYPHATGENNDDLNASSHSIETQSHKATYHTCIDVLPEQYLRRKTPTGVLDASYIATDRQPANKRLLLSTDSRFLRNDIHHYSMTPREASDFNTQHRHCADSVYRSGTRDSFLVEERTCRLPSHFVQNCQPSNNPAGVLHAQGAFPTHDPGTVTTVPSISLNPHRSSPSHTSLPPSCSNFGRLHTSSYGQFPEGNAGRLDAKYNLQRFGIHASQDHIDYCALPLLNVQDLREPCKLYAWAQWLQETLSTITQYSQWPSAFNHGLKHTAQYPYHPQYSTFEYRPVNVRGTIESQDPANNYLPRVSNNYPRLHIHKAQPLQYDQANAGTAYWDQRGSLNAAVIRYRPPVDSQPGIPLALNSDDARTTAELPLPPMIGFEVSTISNRFTTEDLVNASWAAIAALEGCCSNGQIWIEGIMLASNLSLLLGNYPKCVWWYERILEADPR